MNLKEWQEKLDEDFPFGAICHRETDPTDTAAFSFRTACLTALSLEDNILRLFFYAKDNDGFTSLLETLADSYEVVRTEPLFTTRFGCTNNSSWTFAALPERVGGPWKALAASQRAEAQASGL